MLAGTIWYTDFMDHHAWILPGSSVTVRHVPFGITNTISITSHCLLLVDALFSELGFCNSLALGCLSGRFLKQFYSYWHNWELKKTRKAFYTKKIDIEKKTITKKDYNSKCHQTTAGRTDGIIGSL